MSRDGVQCDGSRCLLQKPRFVMTQLTSQIQDFLHQGLSNTKWHVLLKMFQLVVDAEICEDSFCGQNTPPLCQHHDWHVLLKMFQLVVDAKICEDSLCGEPHNTPTPKS